MRPLTNPWVLTGAIGTGKSTVGSMLAAHGARVIDADRVGHAVIEPDGDAFEEVARTWPEVVDDGRVDRSRLGEIVFADPEALRRLEEITHPRIVEKLEAFVRAGHDVPTVVEVSVPHLRLSSTWNRIVVVATADVRRERLRQRGMSDAAIEARMAAQPPARSWVSDGDVVVENDGDLGELQAQVDDLWSVVSQA